MRNPECEDPRQFPTEAFYLLDVERLNCRSLSAPYIPPMPW